MGAQRADSAFSDFATWWKATAAERAARGPDVERAQERLRGALRDARWLDDKEAAEELRDAVADALRALDGDAE